MSLHSDITLIPRLPIFALTPEYCVVSGEAASTNLTVSCRSKPTIYCTGGEHVIDSTTDAVCTYIITLAIDS